MTSGLPSKSRTSTAATSSGATSAEPSRLVPSFSPSCDTSQLPASCRVPSLATISSLHFVFFTTPATEAFTRTQPAAGLTFTVISAPVAGSFAVPTLTLSSMVGCVVGVGSASCGAVLRPATNPPPSTTAATTAATRPIPTCRRRTWPPRSARTCRSVRCNTRSASSGGPSSSISGGIPPIASSMACNSSSSVRHCGQAATCSSTARTSCSSRAPST